MFAKSLVRVLLSFSFCVLLEKLSARAEVFTSTDRLITLLSLETELLGAVKKFMDEEAKSGRDLDDKWIKEYERLKTLNAGDRGKPNFTENPLNSYHLLNRMTQSWQALMDYIICEDCESWQRVNAQNITIMYQSAKTHGSWPTEVDCKGAGIALVRLSDVYNLDMTELIEGRIYDTQTNPLTDDEIFLIVNYAEEIGLSYECLKWLNAGLTRSLKGENKILAIRYYKDIASFYYGESMPWRSKEVIQEALKFFPHHKTLQRDLDYYRGKTRNIPQNKRTKEIKRLRVFRDYEALCNGSKGNKNRGLCQYRKTRIPIYVVKEEIFSRDPRISMFYDVIYEKEIQYVKNQSWEKLNRSIVVGNEVYSDYRISQSAWLGDTDNILKLTHRVELITGLSLTQRENDSHSEFLQVLNYGIGGMYEPHFDFFNNSYLSEPGANPVLVHSGDRLATFLFYLNDVKAGGSTVFPTLNIRVPLVKGAAAFWYNLKRTSAGDDRTQHGGCPVLLGSKWVCNKWIRLNGNMFNARCGMHPDSVYELQPGLS